jgi:hypothetical protein
MNTAAHSQSTGLPGELFGQPVRAERADGPSDHKP